MHAGYGPVLVPNPNVPCAECTRLTNARHTAERAGDWALAERLRRATWEHWEGAHRG